MKFIITVNIETAESESGPQTPIGAIVLTALPLILDALGITQSDRAARSESDTIPPPSSEPAT